MGFGDFAFGAGIGSQAEDLYYEQQKRKQLMEMQGITAMQQFAKQQQALSDQEGAKSKTGGGSRGGSRGSSTPDQTEDKQKQAQEALNKLTADTVNDAIAKFFETGDGEDFIKILNRDPQGKASKLLGNVQKAQTITADDIATHRQELEKEIPQIKEMTDQEAAEALKKRFAKFIYVDQNGKIQESVEDMTKLAAMTGYSKTADKSRLELYIQAANPYDKYGNIKGAPETQLKKALLYAIAHDAPEEDIKQIQEALNTLKGGNDKKKDSFKLNASMSPEKAFVAPYIKELQDAINSGASEEEIRAIQNKIYQAQEKFKALNAKYKSTKSARTGQPVSEIHAALMSKTAKDIYNEDAKKAGLGTIDQHPKVFFKSPSGEKVGVPTITLQGVAFKVGSPQEAEVSLKAAKDILNKADYEKLKSQIEEMYPPGAYKRGAAIYNAVRSGVYDPIALAKQVFPNATKSQASSYARKIELAKEAAIKEANANGVGLSAVLLEKWLYKTIADTTGVTKLVRQGFEPKQDTQALTAYDAPVIDTVTVLGSKLSVPNVEGYPMTIAGLTALKEKYKDDPEAIKAIDKKLDELKNTQIGSFLADAFVKGLDDSQIIRTLASKLNVTSKSGIDKIAASLAAVKNDLSTESVLDPTLLEQKFQQHFAESTKDRSQSITRAAQSREDEEIRNTLKKVYKTTDPLSITDTQYEKTKEGRKVWAAFKQSEAEANSHKNISNVEIFKQHKDDPHVAKLLAEAINIGDRMVRDKLGFNGFTRAVKELQNIIPQSTLASIIGQGGTVEDIGKALQSRYPSTAQLWNKLDYNAKEALALVLRQISGQAVTDKEYQKWLDRSYGNWWENSNKRLQAMTSFFGSIEDQLKANARQLFDMGYKTTAVRWISDIERAKTLLPKGAERAYRSGVDFQGDVNAVLRALKGGLVKVKDLTKRDREALRAYIQAKKGGK